jgi:hypothetical protein
MSHELPETAIELFYGNIRNGWADVRLSAGTGSVELKPSYMTDALGDFLRAVREMVLGDAARCLWDAEPEVIEWTFERRGDIMHLRVREHEDPGAWTVEHSIVQEGRVLFSWWTPEDSLLQDGEVVFEADGNALSFARQAVAQADAILEAVGAEAYEKDWRKPFPAAALRQLRAAITIRE